MSRERLIRRSNQEVFFITGQDHLQELLGKLFGRCTELFAIAQKLFPETRMHRKKHYNVPTPGFSQLNHDFTFNFGFEEPQSVWIAGERDYILRPGQWQPRYTDKFFRFYFDLDYTEELLELLDRDRLMDCNPNFFVQRTDLGTFESGTSWSLKDEYREDREPESPRDPFSAPVFLLEKLFSDINRPVTGINSIVINKEAMQQLKRGQLPLSDLPYYPETRRNN